MRGASPLSLRSLDSTPNLLCGSPMGSFSIHHTASRMFCDALSGLLAKAWANTLAGKARAFAKVLAKVLAEALAK